MLLELEPVTEPVEVDKRPLRGEPLKELEVVGREELELATELEEVDERQLKGEPSTDLEVVDREDAFIAEELDERLLRATGGMLGLVESVGFVESATLDDATFEETCPDVVAEIVEVISVEAPP